MIGVSPGRAGRVGGVSRIADVGAGATMRAVANRLLAPPEAIDATKTNGKSKTGHILFNAVVGQIEIWWPNFRTQTGGGAVGGGCSDKAPGAVATGTGSITYTDKDTSLPVTVNLLDKIGGTPSLSAPDGGYFKAVATINAAALSTIFPKITANFPNGIMFSLGRSNVEYGDAFEFGTAPIALAGDPVSTFPSFRTDYSPCLIAAVGLNLVWGITGDSRNDGLRDMANDAAGNIGTIARLVGGTVAVVNMSGRGDKAQSFAANDVHSASRRQLIPYFTTLAVAEGINDFSGNRSAAQVLADNQSIVDQIGKPDVWMTINPFTIGGYSTAWSVPNDASRQSYNTSVRAKARYVDPAIVMQAAGNAAAWSCEDAVVTDYLHETAAGNAWSAANAPIVGTSLAVHGIAARAGGTVMPPLLANLSASPRDINTGTWAKSAIALTAGQVDAECNSLAQNLLETAGTSEHYIAQGPITVSPGTYEVWIDIAKVDYQWVTMELNDNAFTAPCFAAMDLNAGAIGNKYSQTPASLNIAATAIAKLTNGFYRFKATFTLASPVTSIYVKLYPATGNLAGNSHAANLAAGFKLRPHMRLMKTA